MAENVRLLWGKGEQKALDAEAAVKNDPNGKVSIFRRHRVG